MTKENANNLLKNTTSEKSKNEITLEYTNENNKYEKKLDLSILNIDYNLENALNTS